MSGFLASGPLAGNDCEALHAGFLHQPVNALTSLAFLVAGLWIAWRAVRAHREARAEMFAFAVVVASNALGSFAYHGSAPSWGKWAHDLSALAVPLFVAVHDLGLVRGWRVPIRLWAVLASLGCLGGALFLDSTATVPVAFVLAVAAAVGEAVAFRKGYRPHPSEGWNRVTVAWVFFAATLALGGLSYLFGESGSPLCNPRGWFQPHGVWHILAAVATAAFAYSSLERGLTPSGLRRSPD